MREGVTRKLKKKKRKMTKKVNTLKEGRGAIDPLQLSLINTDERKNKIKGKGKER